MEQDDFEKLLKIRLGKLLQSDDEYLSIFQQRLFELQTLAPELKDLKEQFESCKILTEECHRIAETWRLEIQRIMEHYPKTRLQKLERVILQSEKIILPGTPQTTDERRQKAYAFLRGVFWPEGEKTIAKDIDKAFNERFSEENKRDRKLIHSHVRNLLKFLSDYEDRINLIDSMITLARIHRGILYVGIMNTQGAKLKRKILADKVLNVVNEFGNILLPSLGLAKAIYELVETLRELEDQPKAMKDAEFINNYIKSYKQVLDTWKEKFEPFVETMPVLYNAI